MPQFPSEINPELAELLGALIGDGCMAKQKFQVVFTGDAIRDFEYYNERIQPIVCLLFGFGGNITFRSDSQALLYRFASKEVYGFLKSFGIIPAKSSTVRIPTKIMHGPAEIRRACLRGLFDTDGGVYFDRRDSYLRPYIRICFVSISKGLIEDMLELLKQEGIRATVYQRGTARAKQIQINGFAQAQKFCETIGFSNPRHFRKLPEHISDTNTIRASIA